MTQCRFWKDKRSSDRDGGRPRSGEKGRGGKRVRARASESTAVCSLHKHRMRFIVCSAARPLAELYAACSDVGPFTTPPSSRGLKAVPTAFTCNTCRRKADAEHGLQILHRLNRGYNGPERLVPSPCTLDQVWFQYHVNTCKRLRSPLVDRKPMTSVMHLKNGERLTTTTNGLKRTSTILPPAA
jgi:hypothetical protein